MQNPAPVLPDMRGGVEGNKAPDVVVDISNPRLDLFSRVVEKFDRKFGNHLPEKVADYKPDALGITTAELRKEAYCQRFMATMVAYGLRQGDDWLNFAINKYNEQVPADCKVDQNDEKAADIISAVKLFLAGASAYRKKRQGLNTTGPRMYRSLILWTVALLALIVWLHFNNSPVFYLNALSASALYAGIGGVLLIVLTVVIVHWLVKRHQFNRIHTRFGLHKINPDRLLDLSAELEEQAVFEAKIKSYGHVIAAVLTDAEYAAGHVGLQCAPICKLRLMS